MTREEAIRCLSVYSSTNGSGLCTDKQHYEAKQMAIQALSQEPTYYPPCIDCNKKMDEIRRAYDKLKEQEPCNECRNKRTSFCGNCKEYDEFEPCDDAISRQAVLDENHKENSIWNSITNSEGKNLEEIIFELPPVNPQPSEHFIDGVHAIGYREGYKDAQNQKSGKWIPVSERLPEDSNYYLCCGKDGYMIIGWISKWSKEWCFDDDEFDMDVVAWMPLPQPYKAESEEE